MNSINSLTSGMIPGQILNTGSNSGLLIQGQLSPEEVGKEFESVFVTQLVKEMRQTVGEEGIFGGSADAYGGLFDMFMGSYLSQSGGFGLQGMISEFLESIDVTSQPT